MIIWRGMGILAPIIFAAIYFLIFGCCKIFGSPHVLEGWFPYVGSILAGIVTWRSGAGINREVYQAKRDFPNNEIYSHSLFFIPMEFWAIPFAGIVMALSYSNTSTIKKNQAADKARQEKAVVDFNNKVKLWDDYINNPRIGDYYIMSFKSQYKNPRTGRKREQYAYYLPVKVIGASEEQIEFHCPITNTYNPDLKIFSKKDFFTAYFESEEEGYEAWVDKSALRKAVRRDHDDFESPVASMPTLVGEDALSVARIWRIDGPVLKLESGTWKSCTQVHLTLKNYGTPFRFKAIQYKGNKITFTTDNPYSRNPESIKKNVKGTKVNIDDRFYLRGDLTNTNTTSYIEIFGEDLEGRNFRFDLKMGEGNQVLIERSQVYPK